MAEDHLKRSASFGATRRDEPSFEEDPLVELARIVAEDGGFYRQSRAPELRPARNEPARHVEPFAEESLANELEAELMQNLDLPSHRQDQPRQGLVTEPRARGGAPEAEPVHVPLRPASVGQHHQPQDQQQPPRLPEILVEHARSRAAAPATPHYHVRPAVEPAPVRAADSGSVSAPGRTAANWREAERPAHPGLGERFEDDFSALYPDAEAAGAAEDFEASIDVAAQGSAEIGEASYEDAYSAPYEYADSNLDEFVDDGAAADPRPERHAPVRGRRFQKGLLVAAGVLGVVVLGGAATALFGSAGPGVDSGPPPVNKAESGPAKVAAATDQAQADDSAGQAVYDRVAGSAPTGDERLVDRAEEPRHVSRVVLPQAGAAADQPAGAGTAGEAAPDGSADRTAAAVVRQEGTSPGERIAGQISSETPAMQTGPRIDPVGPRRVRTVTVRPDGTIESSPVPVRVAQAPAQAAGQMETDFGAGAAEPVPVRTVTVTTEESPSGPLAGEAAAPEPETVTPQTLTPVTETEIRPTDPAPAAPVAEAAQAEAQDAADPAAAAETELAMLPRARPDQVPAAFANRPAEPARQSQPAERQAAGAQRGEPVNLLAGPASPRSQAQAAAPQPAAAAPSSPYAVQLSAQRSEDQARAAFNGLKSQFPSVLGSQQADIQRADLGERGIYYRVRVGARSQAEANQLCEQLKAAGGSCFVTR